MMTAEIESSFAEFFAVLEPALFGYVASHFSVKEFVFVNEAFTSCSSFRLVWHSRIKGIMRSTFSSIESKEAFRWILYRGIDARNFQLKLPDCEHSEDSLIKLCKDGDLDLVQSLLERTDIDINCRSSNTTPLLIAAFEGHVDVVKFLCEHGADKEARDADNDTPLLCATKEGHMDVVKLLCEQGVEKDSRVDNNRTDAELDENAAPKV